MSVLQFLVNSFKKAGHVALSPCCRPADDAAPESEPLVSAEEGDNNYRAMEYATRRQTSRLGLTGEYVGSWFGTQQAVNQCLLQVAVYLVVAVVGYSFVFESWPVTDSIYFAVVIFTTVGYGDLSPSNDPSRLFTIFFALYGIVILGVFLGVLGETIIDRNQERVEIRLANARQRVMEQFSEEDNAVDPKALSYLGDVLDISLAMAPISLVLAVIAAPIVYLEGWDVIMGMYWMVVTGTTVGFGDLGPSQTLTKCICILYIPLGVAVLGEFLGRVAGAYIERKNDEVEDRFMNRAMTLGDLQKMDTSKNGKVGPGEFLSYMLVAMQKVEKEEIDEIMDMFKKLDRSNTGAINKEDLGHQYQLNVRPGVILRAPSP